MLKTAGNSWGELKFKRYRRFDVSNFYIAACLMAILLIGFLAGKNLPAIINFTWPSTEMPQVILTSYLPAYQYSAEAENNHAEEFGFTTVLGFWSKPTAGLTFLTGYQSQAQAQAVEAAAAPKPKPTQVAETTKPAQEVAVTPVAEPAATPDPTLDNSKPLVGIYCTHSAESYTPSDGKPKLEGQNGGIFKVAQTLQSELASLGVPAVIEATIHDYPDWNLSYQNSLASMQAMQAKYPSIAIWVDVHRDASLAKSVTTFDTGTTKVAKIMFIVGSNKRLPNPNWQQNEKFAHQIDAELAKLYPGVSRGVRVQSGRYNQHISSKAILVEIGATENTLKEAEATAKMLAQALKTVIAE